MARQTVFSFSLFFRDAADQISVRIKALPVMHMRNKWAVQGKTIYIHRLICFVVISPAGFSMHMFFHTADQLRIPVPPDALPG